MAEQVQEWVTQARQGDADAFAMLIDRYERSALAVAYALLHDADRAGDAVQEGFLRAWQELGRLQDPARFGGWLMQIIRNAAIDLRRRSKKTTSEFPDLAAATPDPALRTEEQERDAQIQAALATLDETTRAAVTLRYYDGLSAKEIAEVLDVSPASVDMRLSRARGQLREKLADLLEPALIPRAAQDRRSDMTVLPPTPPSDNLDELVRGHLERRLEGQRGRAAAAFRRGLHAPRTGPMTAVEEHKTFSFERAAALRQVKMWAGAASALAACLALVVTLQLTTHGGDRSIGRSPSASQGSRGAVAGGGLNVTDVSVPQMDQVEVSRDVDGGTAMLQEEGRELPVRVVREQRVRHTQWFDPREKATYSVTEPVEKVGYVRIQPY